MNTNARRLAAACSLAALLQFVPESIAGSPAGARPNAAAADAMGDAISESAEDRPVVRAAVEGLLDFIAEKRGKDAARVLSGMRKPGELGAFLASAYGATVYEEALEAFAKWDKAARAPDWKADGAARLETEHFAVIAMPGTAAYRDRDYVARLVERLASETAALIGPTGAARERLRRNLDAARTKKVEIALPPSSKAFGRRGSQGEVSLGFTALGSDIVPAFSIRLPYYNALSAASLAPEIAHVIDIFCKLDSREAPPLPEEGLIGAEADQARQALAKWARSTFEEIMPYDKGFGEGLAEYAADRACPFRRAFYGDPDDLLARKKVSPSADVLKPLPDSADRLAKFFHTAELDSFVSFLVERGGLPRFLDFYMSAPQDEKRFKKAYGKSFTEAQAEWRATIGS